MGGEKTYIICTLLINLSSDARSKKMLVSPSADSKKQT